MKKNKTLTITLIVISALILLVVGWFIKTRNNFVRAEEGVSGSWSQVENAYQRRADLVPNLVSTVKGASQFEQETFTAVTQARSGAMQVQLTGDDLTEENVARFQQMQDNLKREMDKAISVTLEAYPELKATQAYRDLMVELEGCENRISVERKAFNDKVMEYNKSIRLFPASMVASMCGFEKKGYFKAVEGADVAPTVEF